MEPNDKQSEITMGSISLVSLLFFEAVMLVITSLLITGALSLDVCSGFDPVRMMNPFQTETILSDDQVEIIRPTFRKP